MDRLRSGKVHILSMDNALSSFGEIAHPVVCLDLNATSILWANEQGEALNLKVGRGGIEILKNAVVWDVFKRRLKDGFSCDASFRKEGGVRQFQISPLQYSKGPLKEKWVLLFKETKCEKLDKEVSEMITETQQSYNEGDGIMALFGKSLECLLKLTGSEYGFIGQRMFTEEGKPFLHTYAVTDISWDEATRAFYMQNAPYGWDFMNMDTLFGLCLLNGEVLISNNPAEDPRRGGKLKTPKNHPPLNAFMGVPIHFGKNLLGMAGIANRKGGYSMDIADALLPLMHLFASIFKLYNLNNCNEAMKKDIAVEKRNSLVASMAKTIFLKNISHEVRTPLNAITSITSLLAMDESLSEEYRSMMEIVGNSSQLLLSLFNDLLLSRKLMSGTLQLNYEKFSPEQVLKEAVALSITQRKEAENIEATVHSDPRLGCTYIGDKYRLLQVVCNLVGNCLKYATGSDIRIYAHCIGVDEKARNAWFDFRVEDDGPGMRADWREMFDYFSVGPAAVEKSHTGSGMGLSLCFSLCSIQGGLMWVEESENEKGCKVCFTIPYLLETEESQIQRLTEREKMEKYIQPYHVLLLSSSKYWTDVFEAMCSALNLDLKVISSIIVGDACLTEMKEKECLCFIFIDLGSYAACGGVGDTFVAPWEVAAIVDSCCCFKHLHIFMLVSGSQRSDAKIYSHDVSVYKKKTEKFGIQEFHSILFEYSSPCSCCKKSGIGINMVPTEYERKMPRPLSLPIYKSTDTCIVAFDNVAFLPVLKSFLRDKEISCFWTNNGKDLVDACLKMKDSLTLVLFEIRLPIMSGDEAIQRVAQLSSTSNSTKGFRAVGFLSTFVDNDYSLHKEAKEYLDAIVKYPCSHEVLEGDVLGMEVDSVSKKLDNWSFSPVSNSVSKS